MTQPPPATTNTTAMVHALGQAQTAVEARLVSAMAAAQHGGMPERLVAAMRHGLLAGGKRFRPFLVLETAKLHGGMIAERAALTAAAALECIHAYSLIHDDLPAMDNDALRRGAPTVWKQFDEWTAILAGDALLTLAFELLAGDDASEHPPLPPAVRLALVRRLAQAAGGAGMVGGQALDLAAAKLAEPAHPDERHVRRLQAMKTGALIAFATEAGAIVAGATAGKVRTARTFGEALGLAFQISDDLLDATGDAASVGKAVGKDAALGKATLVGLNGVAATRRELDRVVEGAVELLSDHGPEADTLRLAARYMASRQS